MGVRDVVYDMYARHLVRDLAANQMPKHVGVILDGNRRWASLQGTGSEHGHRAGAAKIEEFLGWCEDADVEVVTLWLLSTDNLERPAGELDSLLHIIEGTVTDLAATGRWRIHPVGALDLLPAGTAEAMKEAEAATKDVDGLLVNVAVGYGGRREVVDAVRGLLAEHHQRGTSLEDLAEALDAGHIAEHLYTQALLLGAFDGWDVLASRDADLTLAEGSAHAGRSHVISMVLRKPRGAAVMPPAPR